MATFSSAVLGRCVPVPTSSVTFSRRIPARRRVSSSGVRMPRSPRYGTGRVMSEVAMQTVSPAGSFFFEATSSPSVGDPMGLAMASRMAAPASGSGRVSFIPRVRQPGGTFTASWPWPYSTPTSVQPRRSAPASSPAIAGFMDRASSWAASTGGAPPR